MPRFWNAALLAAALIAPLAIAPTALRAEDQKNTRDQNNNTRTYHDKQHNDDHQWNTREDQAYGKWVTENHRKNTTFAKLKVNDQQAYWGWRHEHSDALLNITIR